jgi:hypothetical protein
MPTIDEILQTKTSFKVGSTGIPTAQQKNEGSIQSSLQNHKDKDR